MKILFIFILALFVSGCSHNQTLKPKPIEATVNNFDSCVKAGNPVMESYPRQCNHKGQTFVEDIGNELDKQDLIHISLPRPNQKIRSPLSIKGQARGYWFFEGDFPIKLYDNNDNLLASKFATSTGEWMTEDWVEFNSIIYFSTPDTSKGKLILERNNPSDLAANDDELIVPLIFKK